MTSPPPAYLPLFGEGHFHKLLDALPAAAYTCDPEGLITYFNRTAAKLWGREPRLRDPEDRYCGSFKLYDVGGSPIPHEACWMALSLKHRRPYLRREIVVERPDGRRRTALAHANPIHDVAGRFLGAVNVLVDITDRKNGPPSASSEDVLESLQKITASLQLLQDRYASTLDAAGREHIGQAVRGAVRLQELLSTSPRPPA